MRLVHAMDTMNALFDLFSVPKASGALPLTETGEKAGGKGSGKAAGKMPGKSVSKRNLAADADGAMPSAVIADQAGGASGAGEAIVGTPGLAAQGVLSIFEEEYRLLRPRAPMPPFKIRFRRFVSLNTTIRLREGELHVSLSDLLEGAPSTVLHAIAHILIAKIYKKPIEAKHNHRYKRFQYSEVVARQTEQIRHARGAKRFSGPEGRYYHLEEVFRRVERTILPWAVGAAAINLERAPCQAAAGALRRCA